MLGIYDEYGSVCYESSMLNSWIALAGWDNNGEHAGRRRTIRNAEIGSLAVLTLVTPNDEESNRRIFALFIIDEYFEGGIGDDGEDCEGFVACTTKYKLNFTKKETNDLRFWNFYSNENTSQCRWGSGLFRYLSDEQSAQILKQAVEVKKGTSEEECAKEIFHTYCEEHGLIVSEIQEPSGAKNILTYK